MDMYVRMFDDLKRGKDETIVKYSVLEESRK
jgi:hypothetical protein